MTVNPEVTVSDRLKQTIQANCTPGAVKPMSVTVSMSKDGKVVIDQGSDASEESSEVIAAKSKKPTKSSRPAPVMEAIGQMY